LNIREETLYPFEIALSSPLNLLAE